MLMDANKICSGTMTQSSQTLNAVTAAILDKRDQFSMVQSGKTPPSALGPASRIKSESDRNVYFNSVKTEFTHQIKEG